MPSEGGWMLEIRSFESLPSTQRYLSDLVRTSAVTQPVAVLAREQSAGQGSRANRWESSRDDLLVSVAVPLDRLPDDLPVQSASIYFGWLMRQALRQAGAQNVWLKWPNDLYCAEEKIGGVITQKLKDFLVVGIGVNLKKNPKGYRALSTDISALILLNIFWDNVKKAPKWKQILSEFRVEFEQHRDAKAHTKTARIELRDAVLCDDGSLEINGERIHSLR